MAKIGIIINPHSKKIKKMRANPVEFYKRIGGESVDIRLTQNPEDIIKAAEDFKRQGISYLAISGGDGSIHHVISRFISVYKNKKLPAVLVLRDGSMNIIARSYKLKGNGPGLLKKLLKAVNSNSKIKIVYRNAIKVNNMYCFLFGLGFVANFINEFNKGGNKSPLKAVQVILKAIRHILGSGDKWLFQRMNLRLFVDGKELWFRDFFAVYAATIRNLAISFNPTPRAYEKENIFHLIATGMMPGEVLLRLNKIRRGIPIKHPNHYDNIASNLKIISSERFLYQMDGDIYESGGELFAEAGPRIGFVHI